MQRIVSLVILLIVGPALVADTQSANAAQRCNVLLIMTDDLNCELGCYGSQVVKSPQIDRLAVRGVRFDRAYCQYPVCNPSRVSMLSGQRPQTTRVVDLITPTRATLGDAVMLPEFFRQHGYRTVKLGKIFHTGAGFEDPRSWDVELTETEEAKDPPADQVAKKGFGHVIMLDAADEATWDGRLARRAVKDLGEMAANDRPFFLAVGFRRPHVPYIAPRRYFEMYPANAIPRLTEPADHLARIPRLALTYACYGEEVLDTEHRAEVVAAYYASLSFVDAQLGLLLDALDRLRLWDNTVVIFTSDHGYHLGEHGGLWHKMTLFEASARVPLIIAAAGKKRGEVSPRLAELVDLYPTLIELCGLPAGKGLQGVSLVPLLDHPQSAGKRAAYTVVSRVGNRKAGQRLDPDRLAKSVRTQRWRYTEWPDGTRELYDYDSDPHEYRNLADSAEHAAIVAEHQRLLKGQ
jgi:iduronate 2-sulfatase